MNIVRCPNCNYELQERDARFEAEPSNRFKVTCGKCGHAWSAHHASFYELGTGGPKPRNPFEKLKLC